MRAVINQIRGGVLGAVLLAVAFVVAIGSVYTACASSLHRTCFVTGWALFLAIAIAFTRRFLRLRSGANPSRWVSQQVTLSVAILTLFFMHVEFTRPNGWLDSVLAGLFVAIVISGGVGALLWMQLRSGAIRAEFGSDRDEMTRANDEIRERASGILLAAGASGGSVGVIGDFFGRRPTLVRRALHGHDLSRALGAIESLRRSGAGGGAGASGDALDTLSMLAIEKDRLDAVRVGDGAVRRWLLVHLPCVACLLALGTMHGMIAHAHGLLAHVMLGK
ncbi:MAG: hypothetical protein H6814_07295 [Phycisphaeraceae bacterium]|nr:hypothetical protein [Phycisphaeraceae bacterium]